MSKKLTLEEAIKKFVSVHGDLYDYSLIKEYEGNKIKVPIICKIHGVFYQRPNDHMHGMGCPDCKRVKITPEEYFRMANIVHNGFFSYEHAVYTGANNKLTPTCPIHGDFEVKANNHLSGHNCPMCKKEGIKHKITPLEQRKKSTKKLTQEEVVDRIKELYGDKYSTDDVLFEKTNKKIKLYCKEKDEFGDEHGYFEITPSHLFGGQSCPKCGKNFRYSSEYVIKKFERVHGGLYDYRNFIYVDFHTPGEIICKKHGSFKQSPANHLKGQGCPFCNLSQLELDMENFLKENGVVFEKQMRREWLGQKSLDFYLPEYNIGIECQGIQHFQHVEHFHSKPGYSFEITWKRDQDKREICAKNGIKMVYFSNLGIEYPYEVFEDKNEMLNVIKNMK